MPEPTKTSSAPNCASRAASAGLATPPMAKWTKDSLPLLCISAVGRRKPQVPWLWSLALPAAWLQLMGTVHDGAHMPHDFDDILGATSLLVLIMAAHSPMRL